MKILVSPAILLLLLFSGIVAAQTDVQWRGPGRTGVYPGQGLLAEWPEGGPVLRWSAGGIGKGHSSAVSDGKTIFVTGMKDSTDYLTALDLNGKILWQVSFGPSWSQSFPDTRSTPTVQGDRIYVVSGGGMIGCYSAADGSTFWQFDGVRKFEGRYGDWGVCESLLLDGDKVFYTPGGPKTTVVALDKNTGKTLWESATLHDTSAYVSPKMVEWAGKTIVVTLLSDHLVGVEAETGNILWKFRYSALSPEEGLKIWPGAPKTNAITPLFRDGHLYITGGYNHVGVMFRLSDDAGSITQVWTDTTLDCHHGGVVEIDGYIYGSGWFDNARGNWCCIEWETGRPMYSTKWFTKGAIIAAEGMLYCYEEKSGNVALVKADPSKFELSGTFKVPYGKGPHWSHPVICNGILYIRHGDELMAYDIRAGKNGPN
jgi:outer membrane protein assembly factor BamB